MASGEYTIAMGKSAKATADHSIVIGESSLAFGSGRDRMQDAEERIEELEAQVKQLRAIMQEQRTIMKQLYYAPGMPGYERAKKYSGHRFDQG